MSLKWAISLTPWLRACICLFSSKCDAPLRPRSLEWFRKGRQRREWSQSESSCRDGAKLAANSPTVAKTKAGGTLGTLSVCHTALYQCHQWRWNTYFRRRFWSVSDPSASPSVPVALVSMGDLLFEKREWYQRRKWVLVFFFFASSLLFFFTSSRFWRLYQWYIVRKWQCFSEAIIFINLSSFVSLSLSWLGKCLFYLLLDSANVCVKRMATFVPYRAFSVSLAKL